MSRSFYSLEEGIEDDAGGVWVTTYGDHVYPYIDDEDRGKVALELLGKTREQLEELMADAMEEKHREATLDWGINSEGFAKVALSAIFGDAEDA